MSIIGSSAGPARTGSMGTGRTEADLRRWVTEELAALTEPDGVHWCDGSDAEYEALCDDWSPQAPSLNSTRKSEAVAIWPLQPR